MIETMKSVTIASTAGGRDAMLASLREAGLVHISQLVAKCTASQDIAQRSRALMEEMNAISDEAGKDGKKVVQETLDEKGFAALHKSIQSAIEDRKAAIKERLELNGELNRIEAWGEYDPASVKALEKDGFTFAFYTIDSKILSGLSAEEGVSYIRLGLVNGAEAIATVNCRLPERTPAREFTLPKVPLSAIRARIAELEMVEKASSDTLKAAVKYLDEYRHQLKILEQDSMFERVKATSSTEADAISFISGYLPEDRLEDFRAVAKSNGWAYMISEVGEEDNPPTKLKYRGFVRIMQPIYDILGTVPGYREKDISLWFLIYFAIFFAMIMGDAGYGLCILAIAIVLNVKLKKCNDIILLAYVLSGTTIVYGAITGTWFGSLAVLQKLPFLQLFIIPTLANYSMELFGIESIYSQNAVMQLCFMLGASQLGLACVLNVISKAKERDLSLLGDIGWLIDIVVLYMMALFLVIGASVNLQVVIAGVALGFFLVVVFGGQGPGKSFAEGLKSGLGDLFTNFLNTVSCFSNIMSYIRLFAVGMASLAIAQSFNGMAGMAGPFFGAIIVILGTALNLVMGLLSVIVHGVRLNLLEFSGQLGMEWNGYKYEPFRRTVDNNSDKATVQGDVK